MAVQPREATPEERSARAEELARQEHARIQEEERDAFNAVFDSLRAYDRSNKKVYLRAGSGKERQIKKIDVLADRIVLRG